MRIITSKIKLTRGFVASRDEIACAFFTMRELIGLLNSPVGSERIIATRLVPKFSDIQLINPLLTALKSENKCYPKIEICNSLVKFGNHSIKGLVLCSGTNGNSLCKAVPVTPFRKNSYPLPRDIAARTLLQIGDAALTSLINVLDRNDLLIISEAIAAIGFICFRNRHQDYIFTIGTVL